MGRLFGTDGARGVANSEITPELAMKIGKAAAMVLIDDIHSRKPKVLIGMDTRQSGDMLMCAMAAGFCSVGVDVMTLGVVPTPAVAFLVKEYEYDAAVMISASHNPFEYNGIKIITSDGYKLPDEIENKIEEIILDETEIPPVKIGSDVGVVKIAENDINDYIRHLESTVDVDFSGMNIALDCANGASSVSAETLFTNLGADVFTLSARPNGTNINLNCGSTHIERLQKFVKNNALMVGFAFDGDADRMLAVDENGQLVDGDKIIAICAKYLKAEGKLSGNTAVVTSMTNMGFYEFCKKNDIKYIATDVGDRYVLQEMLANGYNIGGEQSGHVIFLDYATTGDGQLTALQVLRIMKLTGKPLSKLAAELTKYPQVLINVKVSNIGKARLYQDEEIKIAMKKTEQMLGSNGRLLVRVSGTEPLIRIMIEGKDENQIHILAQDLADIVKERLI